MPLEWFFQDAPLWLILLSLFAAMGLAREGGVWLHRRRERVATSGEQQAESYILSGLLGLLALLVAFTFGMSLTRFEIRRDLVVTEANALGTAYLRTSLLEDPGRLRALMRQYAEIRLAVGLTVGAEERAAEPKAAQLQTAIWTEATARVGPSRDTPLAGFVLAPLNEAFDAATALRAALAARLPPRLLMTLVLYLAAAAAMLGYAGAGAGRRLHIASLGLLALFAIALVLILDLDRPRAGRIRVPQGAMAETVRLMATDPLSAR